jgi:hypothetical protein
MNPGGGLRLLLVSQFATIRQPVQPWSRPLVNVALP